MRREEGIMNESKRRTSTAPLFLAALAVGVLSCASGPATKGEDDGVEGGVEGPAFVPMQDKPEFEWWRKSMETRDQRLAWFREARFGMFMHWGVYSELGGVWEGSPVQGYAEHIMRRKKLSVKDYKEKVAAIFNPKEFNADEWVSTAKKAGMGYLIITSKHHDGFAMYDSAVSDFNVVKATPWKHDPMADLKAACKKHGIKFGFYYSQAWDWSEADGTGNDWDYDAPAGDKKLHGGTDWWKAEPALVERVQKYVDRKAIPQVQELIKKYDPDIMWFDTPSKMPPELNLKVLAAARAAKPDLVVSSRICQPVPRGPHANFGDYLSTTDKPADFPPTDGDWEGIPTTNESYGWHKMDTSHKPPSHFIGLLAKAAARGGNLLLNIGPMGTGKFDPKDVAILDGIAAWMKVNGESIHGTTRTPLPVQAWGESTRKGQTLYLHVMYWPKKGRVLVGGLKSPVKRAYLLSDPKHANLEVEKAGDKDVIIQAPEKAPDPVDTVIALEVDGAEIATDPARVIGSDVAVDGLRAFDAQRGGGLMWGAGKDRDAYAMNWRRPDDSIRWRVRVREAATYDVSIIYDAEKTSAGGTYVVKFGDKALPGTVAEAPSGPQPLGRVTVEPGLAEITVDGTKIVGGELMRLRGLVLAVPGAAAAEPAPAAAGKPEAPAKAGKPAGKAKGKGKKK
jgi:alpha-L-fucosidase